MKIFLAFFFSIYVFLSYNAFSLEKGKWTFTKTDEYCYIGSIAIETDLSPEKTRGDFYILVYKNKGNPETIVQIEAGYNYKVPSDIIVNIDKGDYKFYTTDDLPTAAWTEEDNKDYEWWKYYKRPEVNLEEFRVIQEKSSFTNLSALIGYPPLYITTNNFIFFNLNFLQQSITFFGVI